MDDVKVAVKVILVTENDGAYLVRTAEGLVHAVWVAKELVVLEDTKDGNVKLLKMPEWLAASKGLA